MAPRRPENKESPAVVKLRRSHRKSRNGCLECKRRHIKCDEGRPSCSNCVVSERSCTFPPGAVPSQSAIAQTESQSQTPSRGQSPAESPAVGSASTSVPIRLLHSDPLPSFPFPLPLNDDPASQTLPAFTTTTRADGYTSSPASSHQDPATTVETYTVKHLLLLHHAETCVDMFMLGPGLLQPMLKLTMQWASEAPYVLDELLAFTADHMALQFPEDAAFHRRTAEVLQNRALVQFNKAQQNVAHEGLEKMCIPRFIFASIFSVQSMFETFAFYRTNFHVFIDRFSETVIIHRGVRVVISSTYQLIVDSPLGHYFDEVTKAEGVCNGTECENLLQFIKSSDLGPSALSGCTEAIEKLQWAFNLQNALQPLGRAQAGTAWPVLLTNEFVDSLRKRQPEALIILAYYGVLLHRCRHSWLFGDAGAFLIRLISNYLGSFWEGPMQWPLEVLRTETETLKGSGVNTDDNKSWRSDVSI